MTEHTPFRPDWVVHPGASIAEALEDAGLSQAEAAERLDLSKKHVNDLIRGRAAVSAETARALSMVLGSTAEFWLRLQAHHDAERVRLSADSELARTHEAWLRLFPVAEMVKLGWIEHRATLGEKIRELLRFFGVANQAAWETVERERATAFRTSAAFDADLAATSAWLRRAERLALARDIPPFAPAAFRKLLPQLRSLSRLDDADAAWTQLTDRCGQSGVAVVRVPAPKGCRASGATFFVRSDRPVLALSGRHRTDDHAWFSFSAEAGHIVLHGKRLGFVEGVAGGDRAQEREADEFARDLLIPPAHRPELSQLRSAAAVCEFAERIGVAPGIVVGRLQHDGLLEPSHLNGLKRTIWSEGAGGEA